MAVFTVQTTADNGDDQAPTPNSLRAAILQSNATPGADRIEFAIGTGPQTIIPPAALPWLTDPVELDGTSQPGFADAPLIELNGSLAGFSDGLVLPIGGSTIGGLVINRFAGDGIYVTSRGNRIVGNYIGTDTTGTLDFGNGRNGVFIYSGFGNSVGGATPAEGNLISGNNGAGVRISSTGPNGNNVVQGNRIGTTAAGDLPLGNGSGGVQVFSSSLNAIGGAGAGQGNIIAFNSGPGVRIGGSSFDSSDSNSVRANPIFSNTSLGIDLGGDGVSPNDSFDSPSGPNLLRNFPVLQAAFPSGAGGTTLQGYLVSRPVTAFAVDLFSSPSPHPSGFGDGRVYLGTIIATTDQIGVARIDTNLAAAIAAGQYITATATDPNGNTSEFSQALLVAAQPAADLSLSVWPSTSEPRVGEAFSLEATARNLGPAFSTSTTIASLLPGSFEIISVTSTMGSASFSGQSVTATLGTLRPDEAATLIIRAIPRTAGSSTFSITAASAVTDPASVNNTISRVFNIQPAIPADLLIEASATPASISEPFEYTAVVRNGGPNETATDVEVAIDIPEGLAIQEVSASQGNASTLAGRITVLLGPIPSYANAVVRVRLVAAMPANAQIVATVSASTPDNDSLNNRAITAVRISPALSTNLATSIVAVPTTPRIGDAVIYTITSASFGPGIATGAVLTVDLPDGAQLLDTPTTTQGAVERVGDRLTVRLGQLVPGQQSLLMYTLRAPDTGTLVTTATISGEQPDSNPADNLSTSTVSVLPADPADLAIQIFQVPQPVDVGEALKYSVAVANLGPGQASGVFVEIPIPAGVEIASVVPSQGIATLSGGILRANLGSILADGRALIDLTVLPRAIAPIELVATVDGDGPDFGPLNNRATASVSALAGAPAPLVSGQRLISGRGGISAIILSFDRRLDPAQAAEVRNYVIRRSNASGRSLAIKSARYDALSQTVTLTPARPIPLGKFYYVEANAAGGPGLTSVEGVPIDGDANGLPDGIYSSLIGRGTQTRPRLLQHQAHAAAPPTSSPAPSGPAAAFAARKAARAAKAT